MIVFFIRWLCQCLQKCIFWSKNSPTEIVHHRSLLLKPQPYSSEDHEQYSVPLFDDLNNNYEKKKEISLI